ncbi:MAG: 3-deoxy-manno-octulosonate cytidylyltransferase [Gemmatimonadales bacterium]
MPVLLVVPARVGSTRLQTKPLQPLGGAPLVARVIERAREVPGIDRLVLATDAPEVAVAVAGWHVETILTRRDHESGTDRVAEVAGMPGFDRYDVVVNFQGDEPFLPAEAVTGAVGRVLAGHPIGTAAAPLDPALRDDPARVKVVCDARGKALYFSRAAIPYLRDPADLARSRWWQHLGVYAYRADVLFELTRLPVGELERSERLEQLRALAAGYDIGVALLDAPVPPGIDTPDDLAAAEARWRDLAEVSS